MHYFLLQFTSLPLVLVFFFFVSSETVLQTFRKLFSILVDIFPWTLHSPSCFSQPLLLDRVCWVSWLCSLLPTGLSPEHLSWSAQTETGVFQLRLHQHWLKEEDYFLYLPNYIVFISQSDVLTILWRVTLLKFWSAPDLSQEVVAKSPFGTRAMV